MKKVILMFCAAIMLACFTGCNNKQGDNAPADNVVKDSVLAYETVIVEKTDSENNIKFRFAVDFPVQGDAPLVKEISRNIFFAMGDSTSNDFSREGMNNIADNFIKSQTDEIKEINSSVDRGFAASFTFDGNIKMIENTAKYVTYRYDSYLYSGGAHGTPAKGYFTIDKSTNKVLTLNDIVSPQKKSELKDMIKSDLVDQYYSGEAPAWGDIFNFDLPGNNPGITTDGIVFCYEAYEIDCFAAGLPFCVIPFDQIGDMLTDNAKELVK